MRTITVHASDPRKPLDRFFQHCVGAGRAGEMMRYEALRQLSVLQEDCHFSYLRFHGLLCDEMAVYREDEQGNPLYNWQYVDLVFDEMLARGIRPLVEVAFMPDALKSGPQTLFWWRANVTPPASLSKWEALVEALARHLTARYGVQEVRHWYFEIWNEPNLVNFFTGTQQDYFDLYDASVRAIKRVDARYPVGGPATAGMGDGSWIADMIAHCVENDVPIDFISTHTYGVDGCLDEYGRDRHTLKQNVNCILKDVQDVYDAIHASARPDLPIFMTEWSTSYTPRDPVHDSYHSASYILYNLKRLQGKAQSMSYWTFTDVFEEPGPGPIPFHGGFGLQNIQGLKKPSYHAYHWLCALPDGELDTHDADSLCARDDGKLHLLLWDYTLPRQDDHNEVYFTRDVPAAALPDVPVTLTGLEKGRYRLTRYRVGYRANDVYTAYLDAGCVALHDKETPTRAQIDALRALSDGAPEDTRELEVDGSLTLSVSMRAYDVVRLVLEKL